jgi:hypothetical protein
MRLHTALTAGALALAPALAMAAGPVMVSIDGQTVPAQETTHIVQTSAGPAKVSTWSWHSPKGHASFFMQTSTGGAPPAWAMRQMQLMQAQFMAVQSQMQQLQQAVFDTVPTQPLQQAVFNGPPMQQLEQAALTQTFGFPAPLSVMFVSPAVTLDSLPAVFVVAPQHAPAPATHTPGLKV